jgi:hypothetical protein
MRLTRILPEIDDATDNFLLLAQRMEERARANGRSERDDRHASTEDLAVDFWMAA